MTRVRFDPAFWDDPCWERLGPDALVLHLTACSYTVRVLSDGLVARSRIPGLAPGLVDDPSSAVERLLTDGPGGRPLWTAVDDKQLRVCDAWDDLRRSDGRGDAQPSRKQAMEDREGSSKRKGDMRERHRLHNAGDHRKCLPAGSNTKYPCDLAGRGPDAEPLATRTAHAPAERARLDRVCGHGTTYRSCQLEHDDLKAVS